MYYLKMDNLVRAQEFFCTRIEGTFFFKLEGLFYIKLHCQSKQESKKDSICAEVFQKVVPKTLKALKSS